MKTTFFAPLDRHSIPKEPTPENKSSTLALVKFTLNFLVCAIILKMNSLVKSFKGLVLMSFGSLIFFPSNSRYYTH